MCDYCKHSNIYGDTVICNLSNREPTYEEYNNCDKLEFYDVMEKEYQEFKKNFETAFPKYK